MLEKSIYKHSRRKTGRPQKREEQERKANGISRKGDKL